MGLKGVFKGKFERKNNLTLFDVVKRKRKKEAGLEGWLLGGLEGGLEGLRREG